MNQLAAMLDTDLTVDPRARTTRAGADAEPGADFGQVLQDISKPDESAVSADPLGRNVRHGKKGKADSLLAVSADPIVSSTPVARPAAVGGLDGQTEAPTQRVEIEAMRAGAHGAAAAAVPGEALTIEQREDSASSATTTIAGVEAASAAATTLSMTTGTEGATNYSGATNGFAANNAPVVPAAVAAPGQAMRLSLARGEDLTRLTTATDGAKAVPPAFVDVVEGGGRPSGKALGGVAGSNGAGVALAAPTSAGSATNKLATNESARVDTAQHKLLASLDTKAQEARSPVLSIGDTTAWSVGTVARDDAASALRQPVATEATLTAPMGSEEWQMDLGTQLVAMIEKGDQSAVINLSPAELGPVQIDVAVREGEVSVAFAAQVADTRSAIEASLPRLREMLAGEGLSLTNSNINNMLSGFSQQKSSSRGGEDKPSNRGRFSDPDVAVVVQATPNRVRRSLVDLYA